MSGHHQDLRDGILPLTRGTCFNLKGKARAPALLISTAVRAVTRAMASAAFAERRRVMAALARERKDAHAQCDMLVAQRYP